MTSIEIKATYDAIANMEPEEMEVAVKAFPIEIIFNELERRECERIELLAKLDMLNQFVGGMTR